LLSRNEPSTGRYRRQTTTVTLPSVECVGCALQLRRQALEWGGTYTFHTCADLDVIDVSARDG